MTQRRRQRPASPDLFPADRVDVLCDVFEREWQAGRSPRIEDYLNDPAVGNSSWLLTELLAVEWEYRRSRSEWPTLAEYTARFPEHAAVLQEFFKPGRQGPSHRESQPFLARVEPFSKLPEDVVRVLQSSMHPQEFAEGERLIRQGEPGTFLLVLCDGEVEISTDCDPHEPAPPSPLPQPEVPQRDVRVIARDKGPQVLGEMALLTSEPRTAHVTALTPVRALVLPADTFHRLTAEYPQISVVLTLLIATRLGRPGREDVLAGKTLDRYRIQRRLGRGGMSVVYEAADVETGLHVALKMMSHRLVYDAAALAQFQREADLIKSFQHENIVRMYGRFAAFHTDFIVMQFCDGQTLEELLADRGELSESEVKRILGQVARALIYAHAADVIHRDVKPSNVMLNRDGTVKLMDFGLAKPLIDTHPKLLNLIAGTPQYMAPEQLAGEPAGKEADLFALGCLTYEMLTGRRLFPETDIKRLMRHHAEWKQPDFSELSVDSALNRFLKGALHKDPHQRHVNLEELASWSAPVELRVES